MTLHSAQPIRVTWIQYGLLNGSESRVKRNEKSKRLMRSVSLTRESDCGLNCNATVARASFSAISFRAWLRDHRVRTTSSCVTFSTGQSSTFHCSPFTRMGSISIRNTIFLIRSIDSSSVTSSIKLPAVTFSIIVIAQKLNLRRSSDWKCALLGIWIVNGLLGIVTSMRDTHERTPVKVSPVFHLSGIVQCSLPVLASTARVEGPCPWIAALRPCYASIENVS